MTPGPVLTTVAVVGYLVAGAPGAALGTLGVFLPAFLLVIFSAPLLPKMRASRFWGAFLAGVNAGVLAAMVVTLAELGAAALRAPDGALRGVSVLLAGGALVVLLRTKVNATWLIAAGALAGLLLL
jgi:chromate transporter